MRRMDRRRFTKELAFLSGVTVTIGACGGGGGYSSPTGGTPPPTTNASGDKLGQISANHGHTARITSAEIAAENAVTLNIEGTAGHPHMVTVPTAAIRDLRAGRSVQVTSTTTDAHNHTVVFSGESPEPPGIYGVS
jgi:hypothetical protein